ncbi:phosphotransferase [Brevibacterium senegalense]|uniref:phosphotransferase n=1 Tax=Brevibacterium senegalense TaxID=1033736 RepID=UPI0002E5B889|nr:phosphotransferase [Brevibacterium senegalense]
MTGAIACPDDGTAGGGAPGSPHLRRLVAGVLGEGEISAVHPVTAGASKEIDLIDYVPAGGDGTPSTVVLRAEPSSGADADGMLREAALLTGAAERGVPVPRVLAAGRGGDDYPVPYVLTTFVAGESLAPRLLRRFANEGGGEDFVRELGGHLARIHAMAVPDLIDPAGTDEHADWHERYRALGVDSAAFEWAFRWLEDNRPSEIDRTLVHGDFRLGNLMVDSGRVTGVLDWELSHVGDPREDLGWLCAPPWRFRSLHPVAGIGSREALLQGYRNGGGQSFDPADLRWWEVLSTVKWGVMCLGRGREAAEGADRRLEIALIGRRFAECEYDVLRQLGSDTIEARYATARQVVDESKVSRPVRTDLVGGVEEDGAADTDPTVPQAGLIEEALLESMGSAYEGRLQAAALRTLLREACAGETLREEDRAALARAGHASESALATSIRGGSKRLRTAGSHLTEEERNAVEQVVCTRLALANPAYLPRT